MSSHDPYIVNSALEFLVYFEVDLIRSGSGNGLQVEVNAPTRASHGRPYVQDRQNLELEIAFKIQTPKNIASDQPPSATTTNQSISQNAHLRFEEVPPELLQQQHTRALPRSSSQTPIRALRPTLRRHNAAGQFLPHTRNSAAIRATRPESEDDDRG